MTLSNTMTPDEARMVFTYVMQRATDDMAFRHALLHDPKTTLEQEFDLDLPPHFNIRFVENHGADLTIVLPDPREADGRLQDRDLEYVGGGLDLSGGLDAVRDGFVRHLLRHHPTL